MPGLRLNRRTLFKGGAAITFFGAGAGIAQAKDTPAAGADGSFVYEVTRTDAEWRARLDDEEYEVLRNGETEFPFTSPLASENNPGRYHCVGCELELFSSDWYSPQEIGFVFFEQAVPNSVLTGVHTAAAYNRNAPPKTYLEVHCRRCGSHLGHIVSIKNKPLYCINGTALDFKPTAHSDA